MRPGAALRAGSPGMPEKRTAQVSEVPGGSAAQTARNLLLCITMHARKTPQSDSARFSGGKTCSFAAQGVETR